jgi:hypothetical protein
MDLKVKGRKNEEGMGGKEGKRRRNKRGVQHEKGKRYGE